VDELKMKYRIVEFKPGKYLAQKRFLVWRKVIGCVFVSAEDAEKSIILDKAKKEAAKRDRKHKPRVVKVIDGD
jgi:hypothetical protein